MPNISLRGLDHATLSRIRFRARRRGVSVNRLIVETLQREYTAGGQVFDDLDSLAGAWSGSEAAAFAASVAPLAEIDPRLWAAVEPGAAYRTRSAKRKQRK